MVKVGQLMTKDLVSVEARVSITHAAKVMSLRQIGSVFVKRQEEIVGIVTEPDIIRKGISQGLDLRLVSVMDIMSSPIISIDERRPITEAADLMQEKKTRHLAVRKGEQFVGVLSVRDLLHPVSIDEF